MQSQPTKNKELTFHIQNLEFPPYEMDKWSIGRTYLKKYEEEKPPYATQKHQRKGADAYIYIPWK